MPTTGILSWNNESSVTPYPLSTSLGVENLIIDANFIQFDGFVPILTKTIVTNNQFLFDIKFDRVSKILSVDLASLTGSPYRLIARDDDRYLGQIILGAEAYYLYNELVNKSLKPNIPFLPSTVRGIPSKCGVYGINTLTGDLVLEHDDSIWYQVSGNSVTLNAVGLPNNIETPYLKTLNLINPENNNIFMKDSETIKITSSSPAAINFSLVGMSNANLFIEQNNTIPTNTNPA